MPDVESISKTVGGLVTIWLAWIGLLRWLRPVTVRAEVRVIFDGTGPDEIIATLVNRSRSAQYVTSCTARGTFPTYSIVLAHLRRPLLHPRLYRVLRYKGASYQMLSTPPLKLDAQQPGKLVYRMPSYPLAKFLAPMVQVEVVLSNGRKVRSQKVAVPGRWRLRAAPNNSSKPTPLRGAA